MTIKDPAVIALKLQEKIESSSSGLHCDVRVSKVKVGDEFPSFGAINITIVTVTLWGVNEIARPVTFKERHTAHEILAKEFWNSADTVSLQILT